MISVEEALQKILQTATGLPPINAKLRDCTGLVLAQDTLVGCDSPPFDKSMMDGFALSSKAASPSTDAQSGSNSSQQLQLTIVETITAGTVPRRVVDSTSTSRIMTGAPMPEGADCVVPIERATWAESRPDVVQISASDVISEKHVLRKGSIAVEGDPLLSSGTQLQAQHVAALAEFGMAEVPCCPRPKVAVLATGDELLDVSEALTPGRIRNSNEPMLQSQVIRADCTGTGLGIAVDDFEALESKVKQGLAHDVLLLSGGVSAGMLDLVPQVFQKLGVTKIFHKIAMKPGKPLWFGQVQHNGHTCLVFGLPGNPVSSMVCFEVFVRPALRKIAGLQQADHLKKTAVLRSEALMKGDRITYFPATLHDTPTGLEATPLPWAGSADLRTTASANGLIVLRPGNHTYCAGTQVDCLAW